MNAPKKSESDEAAPIRYDEPHPRVGGPGSPTSPPPIATLGGRPYEGSAHHKTVGILARNGVEEPEAEETDE